MYVDGSFWSGVSVSALAAHNLYVDKEVTEPILGQVFRLDIQSRLYDRCLRIISVRPRSLKEVQAYLDKIVYQKGRGWLKDSWYEQESQLLVEAVELVLKKLQSTRLIDDDNFAKWWVDQRQRNGMKGWMVIRSELLSKGIGSEMADRYKIEEGTEYEMVSQLFEKFKKQQSVTKEQCIRRLLSRGFSWDVVKKVVDVDKNDEYGISVV